MDMIEKYGIPHNLKTAIKNKQLVIFIGAGVSRAAGLPSWYEIVKKTLADPAIRKGKSFITALDDEVITPLEALDKIKEENIREVYKHFENETSKTMEHKIFKTICKISKKIITTNYDNLIEHNTNIPVIDTSSTYNLQKIDSTDEYIIKIHGTTAAIDRAIIFTSDYEDLYGGSNKLAKFQLDKVISSNSCLFIGFSLNDNYVKNLFDNLNKTYQGLGKEHYIISSTPIDHDFVELIKIENHEELPIILEHLSEYISEEQQTPPAETENLTSALNTLPEEGILIHLGQDTPPQVDHWTGRSEELKALAPPYKVCFITGIGGQGKSALASKFLSNSSNDSFSFSDWRDFKEEELNLQSKLYQMVELVSAGKIKTKQLAGLETESIIDIFFRELGDQKGIFVFDNIDKYIDLQKFIPSGDMGIFFNKALKIPHNSKFIFTCRPFIHHATIGFYQVKLEGLELEDSKELIKKYHSKIDNNELSSIASDLHKATKGHPLWMGLILAQSRTDIRQMQVLINKINQHQPGENNNISSLVSETILENVWTNLKERERVILRTLSISNISETEDDLAKITSKKINHNQYSKALKSLKSLNLIVTKESGHVELHPLVREFIKSHYGKEDQESYISLYVAFLDGFIVLLKNKFGKVLPHEDIEKITKKIEVLIDSDKLQDAINELRSTGDSFQVSGYCEEYLRLTDQILNKNIWKINTLSKLHGFFDFAHEAFTRMSDFGNFSMFDIHIKKYLHVFSEPDANLILAKSALCHRHWAEGNFGEAIKQGKSVSDLIDFLGESDTRHGKHRYYLALRDSQDIDNIQEALDFFCEGKSVDSMAKESCTPSNASYYGNIGRCLLYLGRIDEALSFIAKSYQAFNTESSLFFNRHNLGYASKWIAEALEKTAEHQSALYFYINAKNLWKDDMPVEANKLEIIISKFQSTVSNQSIVSLESWQITKFCDQWVKDLLTAPHES